MNITRAALSSSRLTIVVALLLLVVGVFTFLDFPSQEEPSVTVREATVSVSFPGMPATQVADLLVKPLEEQLREIAGIKRIVSSARTGNAIIQLTAYNNVRDLPALWLRVRAKAADASGALPQGTVGPFVDDDFGRVAAASIAITAPGFGISEMRGPLRAMRAQLYTVDGVERVTMHGLQEDRVYLSFNRARLAEAGVAPQAVIEQLQTQNIVEPGGLTAVAGLSMSLGTTGMLTSVASLRQVPIRVKGENGARAVRLADLADVRLTPADPPDSAAIYQGQPAVVMAVSMAAGRSMEDFGKALRVGLDRAKAQLPVGFQLHIVTFQPDVVAREMSKMHHVMGETVVIVMAVVMLFLGWRTGLIVGAIVPLTILAALIAMRALGVELQTVSIAAIILALGLLVDNGIVIAEDIERRLMAGEDRAHACEEAGRTLAIPLLTSSLAIILAFSPFFFGQTSTNEYLKSLAIVLAVTLLGSWLLSITVTPLLCLHFAKVEPLHAGAEHYDTRFYRAYRSVITTLLEHKLLFIATMTVALAGAVTVLVSIPYDFLPRSDRLQFQIPVTLQPGVDSRVTLQRVRTLSTWLGDRQANPEVVDSIGYVADGGPRIVLGLAPTLPAPNIAYFTVSVKPGTDVDAVIDRVRRHTLASMPDVRAEPKRFSLGSTESGVVAYRVTGPDQAVLQRIAARIADRLRNLPGTMDIHDDWEARVPRYVIDVDQLKARRAGVASTDIAKALQLRYGGATITGIHDDGVTVPVVLRGDARERGAPEDTMVYPADGAAVPLGAVARVTTGSEPSVIIRRDLAPAVTITGRNPGMTASEIADTLADDIAGIKLDSGYKIRLGGELEDSAEVNQALLGFMPHALCAIMLLFVWQFNSLRKVVIVASSVPFVLIGAATALLITGYPFGFMATFGLLALAGIIVNNAVLLLERIDAELETGCTRREAVVAAAIKRFRPILMTKLTCIVGLVPLMLFAGPLWTGMAITMIGGLALGTLVTLGLIPVAYDLLFSLRAKPAA
ncbi:efflux RND transporter permease subunit [Duganella phyllosphaerae]|uniref:Swarming motility protein SwrC n=1 Tax=Duganella phyllosphaerae TaxID=762836 RepID=A0A1E7WZM5_9BURK|nr:efflux RND transporter permease subunit [Duganella phyllosphaerae]OFA05393.1 swarming motility protein SwrC [Duganella phyllosphaerae]